MFPFAKMSQTKKPSIDIHLNWVFKWTHFWSRQNLWWVSWFDNNRTRFRGFFVNLFHNFVWIWKVRGNSYSVSFYTKIGCALQLISKEKKHQFLWKVFFSSKLLIINNKLIILIKFQWYLKNTHTQFAEHRERDDFRFRLFRRRLSHYNMLLYHLRLALSCPT